jgi:hypothetical protein
MTDLLPELASFPVFGIFDGELVALDSHGAPDFPLASGVDDCPYLGGRRGRVARQLYSITSIRFGASAET